MAEQDNSQLCSDDDEELPGHLDPNNDVRPNTTSDAVPGQTQLKRVGCVPSGIHHNCNEPVVSQTFPKEAHLTETNRINYDLNGVSTNQSNGVKTNIPTHGSYGSPVSALPPAPVNNTHNNVSTPETKSKTTTHAHISKSTFFLTCIVLPLFAWGWYFLQGEIIALRSQIQQMQQMENTHRSTLFKLKQDTENAENHLKELKVSLADLEADVHLKGGELNVIKQELQTQKNKLEALETNEGRNLNMPNSGQPYDSDSGGGHARQIWNPIPSPQSDTDFDESINHFRESVRSLMRLTFTSQSRDSWVQIISAVMFTMSEEQPIKPASILLISPSSLGSDFPICFARKLASAINEAFYASKKHHQMPSPKEIGNKYFKSMGSLTSVHDDLKAYLDHEGKAVIIQNLDEIQKETELMVLHAFCENSNYMAHDTRANFISTLTVPYNFRLNYDWTHWNGQQISRDILNSVWKNAISDDKRPALISRVAGSVILLQEGDSCY